MPSLLSNADWYFRIRHAPDAGGMDPEEPDMPWVVKRLGEDVVVYASDYYHWDCAFPDTVKIVAERDDLSASRRRVSSRRTRSGLYKL